VVEKVKQFFGGVSGWRLSPDRFARAGFARDEDHWLIEAQAIQGDHVIGRTI